MTINIDERILLPAFNVLQRKSLRNLAEVISSETINEIVTDPSVIQLQLDDLVDVDAPSPVNGDKLVYDSVDDKWEAGEGYTITSEAPVQTTPLGDWTVTGGTVTGVRLGDVVFLSGEILFTSDDATTSPLVIELPIGASTGLVNYYGTGTALYAGSATGQSVAVTVGGAAISFSGLEALAGAVNFTLNFSVTYVIA